MQLSRLEVKGFKSFGDKITINFDSGITGIVGPNGCGKSNVVDAIRWVLGEQKTRNLRSEKMEDVIFNGTKDRKPHQMAEVSITFNNTKNILPTEYSQVTVTRRYFRSGDSDYELNGVSCRLKDINNLFLDTGIGSDSYAIIELKMVEDILNDRDGSRRELFEEAAGVSKFKIRKKQTLRKLEETDKDLLRVDDLLFEIDKNLKSLEKQAKQTQKYYEIKEEYTKYSVGHAQLSVANLLLEMTDLQNLVTIETDKKLQLSSQIATSEAEIAKTKTDIQTKESALKDAQKSLNDQVAKIRNYESEKKIKNERLKYLTDTQERLSLQLLTDKELKEKSEIIITSVSQELQSITKQLNEQELKLEQLKSQNESQKQKVTITQNQLNEANLKYVAKQKLVYDLNKTLEINQVQISTLKQELENTANDSSNQSRESASFDSKITTLAADISAKEQALSKLENAENLANEKIDKITENVSQIKEQLAGLNRKVDSKQNEYSLTKSLVDNLEGFPEAVRFLKMNADWVKNVPLLSDVLTCNESYRIAIENFLEPYMNYYVVGSEADAIKAINLLSDASKGKANFFILSNFENATPFYLPAKENCVIACEVVEYEAKYFKLVDYLLANVYIVTNENDGNLFDSQHEATFISLNGKIIKRKYSISGGSVGLFEGKRIGRAKNLEILEKEIKKCNEAIVLLKKDIESNQKTVQNLSSESQKTNIDIIQKELNLLNQEYITYKSKNEQLGLMIAKIAGKKDEMLDKISYLQDEISQILPNSIAAQSELANLKEFIDQLNEDLEIEKNVSIQKSAIYNEQNIIYYQQKNKVDSLQQDLDYKTDNLTKTISRINLSTNELAKVAEDTKSMLLIAENNDDLLISMYDFKEKAELLLNEIEKSYYQVRGQLENFEKQVKEYQRQKENADMVLQEFNIKLNDDKLHLASVKERLSLEFNVDLNLQNMQNPTNDIIAELGDAATIKEKITQFKAAMERIGQINPMALEAFNEIKERHELIYKQQLDIVAAKNSLLSTIAEIDTTAKSQFQTTFDQIRTNFVTVFRSLFTEDDNCDVILANPNDPMESDIDIVAKPKGKRPQSINQLSGGEKTLTAVALLFAIYLIKPAPFCIFDEVDAPLDDANIDKFNNIIKKFSADSQFIIVTHNKRTMASTDVIYGVTMIETGISRVVPVDLRNLN